MKKISALILALTVALSLAACGGDVERSPAGESTNYAINVTQGSTQNTTEPATTTPPTTTPPTTTPPATTPPATTPPATTPPATTPPTTTPPTTETQTCQHLNAEVVPNEGKTHPLPTCTQDGYYLVQCFDCWKEWYVEAKALGHTTMETPYDHGYVDATCCNEGRKGAKEYCYVCDTVIIAGDSIPINPYFHVGTAYRINEKKSTCTEDGYSGDICCSYCEKLNHPENKGHVIPAFGHVVSSENKATCCSKSKCVNCGIERGDFDKQNHSGGTETRNSYAAPHACCTGYSGDIFCLGCGAIISKGGTIEATQDHSWQEISRTVTATEISITSQCTICRSTSTVSVSINIG